jgi:hypothetical protein
MTRFLATSVDARPALYDVLTSRVARISTPDAIVSPSSEWGEALRYEQAKIEREGGLVFAASFLGAVA